MRFKEEGDKVISMALTEHEIDTEEVQEPVGEPQMEE